MHYNHTLVGATLGSYPRPRMQAIHAETHAALTELLPAGRYRPLVTRVVEFADVAAAVTDLAARREPWEGSSCGSRAGGSTEGMPFSSDDLDYATEVVRRCVPATPQYTWPLLSAVVGTQVWVKHENHTPTGAFKVRGGLVYADRLRARRPGVTGVVSATRGNHGQSLAFAGRARDLRVTIVVPHGNSPDKNAAMRGLGAEVVEHGHDFQAAREYSVELARELELDVVPPYHPDLVLGVATYARELFAGAGVLDAVYVPVGMGSGIGGLIRVRDLLGLRTEIVGVVSERAPATALSFAAGAVVTTESADTFVDGVACRVPDPTAIAAINAGAARIVQVSDDATAEAVRILFATTHNAAEPAGAIALAAVVAEREFVRGRRVAIVLTGGNIDTEMLAQILAGTTPGVSPR